MTHKTLSDRTVRSLKPAPSGTRYVVHDTVLPGFGVLINDRGRKAFTLTKRYPASPNPNNATTRVIGAYGEISLAEARDIARGWIEKVQRGVDPREEIERERRERARARADTFASVLEEFIAKHLRGKRQAAPTERTIRNVLIARWGDRPVTSISRRDVVELVEEFKDRGAPAQAHAVLGIIRTAYNWMIHRELYGVEQSPTDRLRPAQLIGERRPRQRVLTDDEIGALWRAAGQLGHPWAQMYKLLLLTGARKGEVSGATWGEFDLKNKVWTVPAERFKSGFSHTVPLSADAAQLITETPRLLGTELVFSIRGRPVSTFGRSKERLDRLMRDELGELAQFTIHDIRRTVRTRLSALRVPHEIAEMVIGHGRKGLSRIYDQHAYIDEMRAALEAWSARLRLIVNPTPAEVVKLHA